MSFVIRSYSDVSASIVTSVTSVVGVRGTSSDTSALAVSVPGFNILLTSTGGLGISLSTRSGLKGLSHVADHPALMFLLVSARSLTEL